MTASVSDGQVVCRADRPEGNSYLQFMDAQLYAVDSAGDVLPGAVLRAVTPDETDLAAINGEGKAAPSGAWTGEFAGWEIGVPVKKHADL